MWVQIAEMVSLHKTTGGHPSPIPPLQPSPILESIPPSGFLLSPTQNRPRSPVETPETFDLNKIHQTSSLSRSPPRTTQALTLDNVSTAQLSPPKEYDISQGELTITNTHEAHDSPLEAALPSGWPSTTNSSPPLTLQESHSHDHSSSVIEIRTEPPSLMRLRYINLPSQGNDQSAVQLHPVLSCPERAGITWDFGEPEEEIERMNERWPPLKELASHPPLPSMTVVHPWLPWPITVHASGMDSRGVTVADVLLAISRNLMIPIDEAGERRLNYLRGRHEFFGLQASETGGDVWELIAR
ncbi:hypothetical protein L218DRAFT_948107 [Marasmius fiardii PR-910]|nr:hypothetical protein L218DRAFT_948107 [Marasmius fiardii PR-910]